MLVLLVLPMAANVLLVLPMAANVLLVLPMAANVLLVLPMAANVLLVLPMAANVLLVLPMAANVLLVLPMAANARSICADLKSEAIKNFQAFFTQILFILIGCLIYLVCQFMCLMFYVVCKQCCSQNIYCIVAGITGCKFDSWFNCLKATVSVMICLVSDLVVVGYVFLPLFIVPTVTRFFIVVV